MFLAGFIAGCIVTSYWWTFVTSFYDKPTVTPQSGLDTTWTVLSTDGLGNTTEYRPHWRRSGP